MTRFAPILVAALLAGCAVPHSPPVVAPVAPAALGLGTAAAPLIADDWWRGFGDPQLDRIVTDATAGNPTLDAALARVRQAEAVLASRRADDGPNVTLDGSVQPQRLSGRYIIPPPYGGTVRTIGQVQGNLSWNLDLFGRQRAAIEGARASARAAALDVAAARLAIAGSVVQTYIDLARAEAQARLAQQTVTTREQSLRLVQTRIRNRLASNLQAEAAGTLLAQAREAAVRAEGARAIAANALAALAGKGHDYALGIAPTTLNLDTALTLPKTLPADLLARRPDIAAAQARIEAAAAGRQVARRAFYPNINLAAFIGLQAIGLGNLVDLDSSAVGAGPAIHLPLFDNGRLKADLAGATAAVDIATADYNDRVVGAVRDAADALALIDNLTAQRQRAAEVVRGLSETNRLNAIRVSSGLDSKLDLVDNDIRLLDARLATTNLAADAARQRVALVLALGGGFSPAQETAR
ncbi:efflux transporter outer membrane subunit [Sphingomonas sp. MA1305]|uniref:efflux transporter outer membrane subunit n=1 Tax=Sphingomonas sp. MA1305 TaxID=2479204 RepID=UPI0018E03A42|nr:efflux transporter outer membrane subunit [Sphingomonas sp. MA1305]MBI0475458.1 efflux transporter outer membrane subunit [Sphingomonas sp. MA1305]